MRNSEQELKQLYNEINQVILSRQNPVTGLLPASTSVNAHGDYTDAWVRDNVYSIIAPWALSLAMKKAGETREADELEQATIKLMRGLLQSMMRQAHKVEAFKHTLKPIDALHAKYDTATGLTVVADDAWGHLQIDATSIYLLMIGQMTASGLRIIQTYDEVDFVQNLIYYIASAFRTPDYGIWERGNKINNGKPEINASSLGMAKAALQALDGLNLFHKGGPTRAVVHSVPDALSMARTNLAALLPRESLSKEVDAALLSIIGFPAFAVGDSILATETRDEILKKLGGIYGLKRFLWDGHQTVIEDPSRLYYEHSELANFQHIESEWPLFFCYLYLNALFTGNTQTASHYYQKIQNLMIEKNGIGLIPELYYVPEHAIEAEKRNPKSQARVANDNLPLVWAQSLYYTGRLMDLGLLKPDDLDPVKLRSTTTQMTKAQVALVVLAENEDVKKILADNGVIAESILDIAPLKVISAPHLVEAYAQVGANHKLNLTGRPRRRLLSLASSQTYCINDHQFLCLSWIQGDSDDDYVHHDIARVATMVREEISHIRKHWLNSEVAVFTFMVNEALCNSPDAHLLYECLQGFQLRTEDENIGYASANLAFRASRENWLLAPDICLTPITSREVEAPPAIEWNTQSLALLQALDGSQLAQADKLVEYFADRPLHESASDTNKRITARDLLNTIYSNALQNHQWLIARLAFALSGRVKDDLSDYLSVLSSRHFSVIVGSVDTSEFGLEQSLNNSQIVEALREASINPIDHCLLQELLESIGILQRTNPQLFEGVRSIQLSNLLNLCADGVKSDNYKESVLELGQLSPSAVLDRLYKIFSSQRSVFAKGLKRSLSAKNMSDSDVEAMDLDWFEWRFERGLILSLSREFLEKIWQTLAIAPKIIFAESHNPACIIESEFVRSSMTPGEEIFAQLINDALAQLHPPYFRSAIVEVLLAITEFHEEHPKERVEHPINLEEILECAADMSNSSSTQKATAKIDLLLEESPQVLNGYILSSLPTYLKNLGKESE
ncbi:glycoside hydrolase family 15 protein [Teredinibacter turnerae]|uniref:glycoside hydrolase family 15 protein n=1 Tax=Teredinibacter turnerae TaxID=2426 RepID=UPI0030D2EA42